MPSCVVEETGAGDQIDALFGAVPWQAGLLVGRATAKKHYVLGMVPTPPLPGSEHSPDAADGIKELDAEWVKLHAQRVTNTLPGGLCVLGVYVFCPKDVDTQGPLRRLVFKVAEPSDVDVAEVDTDGVPGKKERIALHICSKSRKTTCRSYEVNDHKSSARPCDWKVQRYITKWQKLSCAVSVNVDTAVPKGSPADGDFKASALRALQPTLDHLRSAQVTLSAGQIDDPASDLPAAPDLQFDTFLPPPPSGAGAGAGAGDATRATPTEGIIRVAGNLAAMAYVPPKSTTGDATTALREDIVRSLVARVVLLCDLFYDEEAAQSGPESIPLSGLPVRLAAPWLADVLVSDYVTADDDLESYTDTVQRFSDIGIKCTPTFTAQEQFADTSKREAAEAAAVACAAGNASTEGSVTTATAPSQAASTGLLAAGIAAAVLAVVYAMFM